MTSTRRPTEQEAFDALLRQRLAAFTRKAFSTVDPGATYKHNWHIDLIAEYLEACTRREIKRRKEHADRALGEWKIKHENLHREGHDHRNHCEVRAAQPERRDTDQKGEQRRREACKRRRQERGQAEEMEQ